MNNKDLNQHWWIVILLILLSKIKLSSKKETNKEQNPLASYQENKQKTKVIKTPIYVDVEAVERANDVAINVNDLNKKTANLSFKYADIQNLQDYENDNLF